MKSFQIALFLIILIWGLSSLVYWINNPHLTQMEVMMKMVGK